MTHCEEQHNHLDNESCNPENPAVNNGMKVYFISEESIDRCPHVKLEIAGQDIIGIIAVDFLTEYQVHFYFLSKRFETRQDAPVFQGDGESRKV
jgi:hypothetical protein